MSKHMWKEWKPTWNPKRSGIWAPYLTSKMEFTNTRGPSFVTSPWFIPQVHPTDTGLIQMLDGSEWKIRWTWLKMDDSWWLGIGDDWDTPFWETLWNSSVCEKTHPPGIQISPLGASNRSWSHPLRAIFSLLASPQTQGRFPLKMPRRGGYKGDPKKSNTKMEVATQLQWHSMAVNGIHSMWHWIETLTLWPPWPSGFHPKTAAMILSKGFRHISTWAQRHLLHGDHVINSTANAK